MPISPPASLTREEESHLERLNEFAAGEFPYPARRFGGRGIIIPAGGAKYFPCAWVCIKMLRQLGCSLPIEAWHLGEEEMDAKMRALLEPLGVRTVDARSLLGKYPARILNGWELKAYALLHSRFEEILLLDADNVPVADPAFLFETPQYAGHGAIFWPDYSRLGAERSIWKLTGVEHRDEPEFESGSIVVHKARCWKALNVAMHLNEHSDFYYRHIHGDKETFHIAWRKIGQEYAMTPHGIHALHCTMCQHDFEGRRIFQHRNMDKWRLDRENRKIAGFLFEKECFQFLELLEQLWKESPNGTGNRTEAVETELAAPSNPTRSRGGAKTAQEHEIAARLSGAGFCYRRIGYDDRFLTLLEGGRVGAGARRCEEFWDVHATGGRPWLELWSATELTCRLQEDADGVWRGQWERHERMPIELRPTRAVTKGWIDPSAVDYRREGPETGRRSRPRVLYVTVYPRDPNGRAELFVTRALIGEFLQRPRDYDLSVMIGSAHCTALIAAEAALADFGGVPITLLQLETRWAGIRAEEIAHCKEQLPLHAVSENFDYLLFMDADVWTSMEQIPAWMDLVDSEPETRFVQVKYSLRDALVSPGHTLGAYFHHRRLLNRFRYPAIVFPKREDGTRADSPDCALFRHLTNGGCSPAVPDRLTTCHFVNPQDAHAYRNGVCSVQPGARQRIEEFLSGTAIGIGTECEEIPPPPPSSLF